MTPSPRTHSIQGGPTTLEESPSRKALGEKLLRSLWAIQRGQHPNGEILSYRRDTDGTYLYCRTPFISTFVHDALAPFDPGSIGWLDGSLDLIPARARRWFIHAVGDVRRRILSFLIWQQEAAGYWRCFGRGSGIDPDVNTTACAALALLEGYGARRLQHWGRQLEAVLGFCSPAGAYYTFLKPGRGGYGWMDDAGRPIVGFDRVVNAEVLRYLCQVGLRDSPETARLVDYLWRQLSEANLEEGTPIYPNPLCFFYAVTRTWVQGRLSRREALAERLVPPLVRLQRATGDFGGPLSTALGATALLNLGQTGPELRRARLAVLRSLQPDGAGGCEDFVGHGFGSPAWTTAASIAFLARDYCLTGGQEY